MEMWQNILLDDLPDHIELSFGAFPIETDYRASIRYEKAVKEVAKTQTIESLCAALSEYTGPAVYEWSFDDIKAAADQLLDFHACGTEKRRKTQEAIAREQKRAELTNTPVQKHDQHVVDFEHDAGYIYSAFRQVYHVDLQAERLHWWAFMAMFSSLPDDCKIVQIMGYRSINPSDYKDAKQKAKMIALKRRYELPDNRSREERIAAAGAIFSRMGGGD